MSTQDDQFVALGPDVGVEAAFLTRGANIDVGGHFEGKVAGLEAVCNNGPAISATAVNNNDGAVTVENNGGGPGFFCPGLNASSIHGEGVFAVGSTNGVHGKSNSQNDSGVWGENTGNGYGVAGSSWAVGSFGGVPGSQGINGKPNSSVGVWGTTVTLGLLADSGEGVLGEGQNGVHGRSRSRSDSGVWGENVNGGFGVSGSTNAGTGDRGIIAGVWGSNSGSGAGVRGTSTGGAGVLGEGPTGVSGQGGVGVLGKSAEKGAFVPTPAVMGEHTGGGIGVWGLSSGTGSIGVAGDGGYGGLFGGTQAPVRLVPSRTAGHPTSGEHVVGELYVDSTGSLFYCRSSGAPGTWVKLA